MSKLNMFKTFQTEPDGLVFPLSGPPVMFAIPSLIQFASNLVPEILQPVEEMLKIGFKNSLLLFVQCLFNQTGPWVTILTKVGKSPFVLL